jgi:Winged helix DNA-binding domain
MTPANRERVLAFRVAGHHLHERLPAGSAARAAAICGLQDLPPGFVGLGLAARVEGARPEDLDELVIVYSRRGAAIAAPREDLAVFTTALAPPDDAAARAQLGSATETLDAAGVGPLEALERVSAAVADALADGPLERDAFHQALRERLPAELLWWCRNCGSHHVHPLLWRATGVMGVLAIAGRRGRTTLFGSPGPIPPFDDPGAELARRFLRAYGPATPATFAAWAGISVQHARSLVDRIAGELAEVGPGGLLLAADRERLADPPRASGVRLLGGYDPYLDQRDREILFPDAQIRVQMRRSIGNPGALLVDGELAGMWRPEKKGRRLVVAVESFRRLPQRAAAELATEAALAAPHRGCATADVREEPRQRARR